MTSNETAATVPTLTCIGSTRHRADYQVADNGAGIFTWPNSGQAMRVATVTLGEEGHVDVRLIPQTKTGRDYKGHHGLWMPLQQLPGDMVGRILDAIGALTASAAPAVDTAPAEQDELVWCETHNPAGTPVTAATAHPLTAECRHPHNSGLRADTDELDDEQSDREPSAEQERAWDARDDDARGHALAAELIAVGPLAPSAPLGRVQFYDGSEDAPRCPCGNDVLDDGFRPVTVAESVDGKIGVFIDPDGAWHALGRHVACLADFCLRVWSECDITRDATGVWAPVKFRLHHLAEADAGEPTPAVHPYFLDKARAVFAAAGGDPANADELAAWAERVRPTGDSRLGVIVTEAGRIVAETRCVPGGAGASYVVAVAEPADSDLVNREAGLAAGALTARHGQTVHVKFSQVCRGAATH